MSGHATSSGASTSARSPPVSGRRGGRAARGPSSAEKVVRITIVRGKSGATLALVPIYLEGRGPFRFAIDTGATRSVIDAGLVRRLHIPITGKGGRVAGLSSIVSANKIFVTNWRAGSVRLPRRTILSVPMPAAMGKIALQGLIGADILRLFGMAAIDFKRGRLILGARP